MDGYLFLMLQQHGMAVINSTQKSNVDICGAYRFHAAFYIGSSALLMGLTLTIACMAEVPLFHYSGAFLRMLGVDAMLHLVLLAFVLRLLVRGNHLVSVGCCSNSCVPRHTLACHGTRPCGWSCPWNCCTP